MTVEKRVSGGGGGGGDQFPVGMRVLAVDDQIRRLSDAWRGPIDGWLRGVSATRASH